MLLGLRHATDPDHLAAVAALIAGDRGAGTGRARRLGLVWGLGHATTLFAVGVPLVVAGDELPEGVGTAAEVAVGILIVVLALRLLLRRRRLEALGRTPLAAYGVGLVHGVGGSGGVGILLVGAISGGGAAVAALGLYAAATAVSMALVSTGFGYALTRGEPARRLDAVVPLLGALSLAFGTWYAVGAL